VKLDSIDIVTVWQALGGSELRGKRGRAFWRDGDGYNVSLNRGEGTWYDFRDGRGGGVLTLVMTARQCSCKEALRWLEENCGLDPLRPLSIEERRRRKLAQAEARELIAWRNGMLGALRRECDRSFRLYHEGVRWILQHGLDSEMGGIVAEISEVFEQRALEAQRDVQVLSETRWGDLVPIFREQRARSIVA